MLPRYSPRLLVSVVTWLACVASAQNLPATAYPERPVTLVAPTAPGGGTDILARYLADRMGKALKQSFVVDNRPGANGILGTENVAHALGDGYRLLFTYTAAHVVNPAIMKKLPYDAMKDFTPIGQIGRGGNLLLVSPLLPVKTVQEFVDHVKAHPDKLSYCSWGNGSGGHLSMENLKKQANLQMPHIPYKGSAPCVQDIVAGHVQAGFGDTTSTMELVRTGKVRALAISGPTRAPRMPDVPTLNEAGYPFNAYSWYGLFAPSSTPKPIIAKLNAALLSVLQEPTTVEKLRELNFSDIPLTTPEQFADTVQKDWRQWGDLARSLNLALD